MLRSLKYTLFKPLYNIFGRNSFSQAGEDAVLDFLLYQINLLAPSYLELGVYEPRNGNNTYKYYLRGAKGVMVEADPNQIAKIKAERPGDKVIQCGVSFTGDAFADLYVFDEPSINTLDQREADIRIAEGTYKLIRKEKVPLKTINQLIAENFDTYPQFLPIDIEGLDYQVLESLDISRFPIPIICAETCTYSQTHIKGKDKRIAELMEGRGYFVYADTYVNTIFIHREWFNKVKP